MATTYTNTNTNAPVAAADDDCGTAYATSADLCAPYITLEEEQKERQEEEHNEQRRAMWGDPLGNAALRALKHARIAEKEETDDAVRAAASDGHLNFFFDPSRDLEVMRLAPLVEECLDVVSARSSAGGRRSRSTGRSASQRGSSRPLRCSRTCAGGRRQMRLRRLPWRLMRLRRLPWRPLRLRQCGAFFSLIKIHP
jgi:hypothetical protein